MSDQTSHAHQPRLGRYALAALIACALLYATGWYLSAVVIAVMLVVGVAWALRTYTFEAPALPTAGAMGGGIALMVVQAYASAQWHVWGTANPDPLGTALSTVPPLAAVPLVFIGLAVAARSQRDVGNRLLAQSVLFNAPAFFTLSVLRLAGTLVLLYAPLAFLWQCLGAVVGFLTYRNRR